MNTKHVQWLQEELPALVREGVLPEETAEKLRQHYGPMVKADGRRLMVLLFGILGAVLIGGGIIICCNQASRQRSIGCPFWRG